MHFESSGHSVASPYSAGVRPEIKHNIQGDQIVSLNLTITLQSSGAQKIFEGPVCIFEFDIQRTVHRDIPL
jgi:hypothetical protein